MIIVVANYKLMPTRVGGMDYFYWSFDKKLKDLGHEVIWFFPNQADFGGYASLTIHQHKEKTLEDDVITYLINNNNNNKPQTIFFHFIELFSKKLNKIRKLTQAKIIVTDHNPRPVGGYTLKKQIKKKINGFRFKNSIDKIISVSERSKADLVKDFGSFHLKKNIVIHNGIKTDNFLKKIDFNYKGQFIVACNLRKEKGIQDLLDVLADIDKNHKFKYHIDIFGEGIYENYLKRKAKQLNLTNHVFFKGGTDKLSKIYKDYDYLIHPSYSETYCFTVVEAYISNLPVITTENAGNILKLIHTSKYNNGFLFPPKNKTKLYDILINILSNKFTLKPKQNSNDLDISNMTQQYIKLV